MLEFFHADFTDKIFPSPYQLHPVIIDITTAKRGIAIALILGVIVPISTVLLMLIGFNLGTRLGWPWNAVFALLGAFSGFGVGTFVVYQLLKRLAK